MDTSSSPVEPLSGVLSRSDQATVVTALIHYSLHVADTASCVRALEALVPARLMPWREQIEESRERLRLAMIAAEQNIPPAELVVRDPDAWSRVAAEGRRFS